MKKYSLISAIIIVAAVLTVVLSGCNSAIYPSIESIDEVFAAMADIKAYSSDIIITTTSKLDGKTTKTIQNISFVALEINGTTPIVYAYPIDDFRYELYMVGEKVFKYKNGVLFVAKEAEDEEAQDFTLTLPSVSLAPVQESYTASYDIINRSVFSADYTKDYKKLAESLGLAEAIDDIEKSTIAIEADNNTKLPTAISYTLEGKVEVVIPADPKTKKEEETVDADINIGYKMVFKKYNDAAKIVYPAEVQEYIDALTPTE